MKDPWPLSREFSALAFRTPYAPGSRSALPALPSVPLLDLFLSPPKCWRVPSMLLSPPVFSPLSPSLGDSIQLHGFLYHPNLYLQPHSPKSLGYQTASKSWNTRQGLWVLSTPTSLVFFTNLVSDNPLFSCSEQNSKHFPFPSFFNSLQGMHGQILLALPLDYILNPTTSHHSYHYRPHLLPDKTGTAFSWSPCFHSCPTTDDSPNGHQRALLKVQIRYCLFCSKLSNDFLLNSE